MLTDVLQRFDSDDFTSVKPFGNGLINRTWLAETEKKKYILQRINQHVFQDPAAIDFNMNAIGNYLKANAPGYLFVSPLHNSKGESIIKINNEYYRLFEYVKDSKSFTVLQDEGLAFEAAKQFGRFTTLLAGFDVGSLKTTLPDFHDLTLRYSQFKDALLTACEERLMKTEEITRALEQHIEIVEIYEGIKKDNSFKKRVTHHDTKISNVLFDKNNKGVCVIDLDTVMPGFFISDAGDMLRTYLSPANEEETDLDKIELREAYFKAVLTGYLSEMKDELTKTEKNHFIYAGKFMIYMQALRFITDYLNNDRYYGAGYELQNFDRAANQLRLLNILFAKEKKLESIIASFEEGN